ncbi:MAG: hypothetical protein ACREVJ_07450 [Gammaproteobacteria bacterium]
MNQPGRALDTFLEHARTAGVLNTDRIPFDEMLTLFERAERHLPRVIRWEKLPTSRVKFIVLPVAGGRLAGERL